MHDSSATAHLAEFLAEVRASTRPVCRRVASPAAFQASLEKVARMMMNRVGVTRIQFLAGIRLTHALAPAFRKFCGPDLARELKHIWRVWRKKGMEKGLAEVITCGLYHAMKAREGVTRHFEVQSAECKMQSGGRGVTKWSSGRVVW